MAQTSTSIERFDVFLSFCGDDSRKTLVDHLYHRLAAAKVRVLIDYGKLQRGNDLVLTVKQAINNTAYLIPIFSKNYARSIRRLLEVCQMVRSRGAVIPVFYNVVPQEIHHQKGPFERAFQEHRNKRRCSEDTIQEWRRSLHAACSASGYSLVEDFDGYEGKLVETLTSHILSKIQRRLTVAKYPVGIEERAAKVVELLQMESEPSRVLTLIIYGLAGSGKTTLAKAVFNIVSPRFRASCFVPDVRNTLSNELQMNILKALGVEIPDLDMDDPAEEGLIQRFLPSAKALVILDDVDDRDVLDVIRGDWFLPGTRIIATSRNKGLLPEGGDNVFYEADDLDNTEALQLFSWHAFSRVAPNIEYRDVSKKIVKVCQGHPLTVENTASLLFEERDFDVWFRTLRSLECGKINEIQSSLKIAYEDLNDSEKEIFLDIACFLRGNDIYKGLNIWEASGWCANLALNNLQGRSLVKTANNLFSMLDIVRDMGRTIVRKENVTEPGKRTRLWDEEEVRKVFVEKMATKSVEGVLYDSEKNVSWRVEDFEPMRNLRLLSMKNAIIEGDFSRFPSKTLRWLKWIRCSLECLPLEFNMKNIAVLELPQSNIKQVWDYELHPKAPKNLKSLNLNNCKLLEKLPDFSRLRSLVNLELKGCERLITFPDSIGDLESLEILDLSDSKYLKVLPQSFIRLVSLQRLDLSRCSNLEKLPDGLGKLRFLVKMNLFACNRLKSLPDSIGDMGCLEHLDLSFCTNLEELPFSFKSLLSLEELNLSNCRRLQKLPEALGKLRSLLRINVYGCSNLRALPDSIGDLKRLKHLDISFCENLKRFPLNFSSLVSLQNLDLSGSCKHFDELPNALGKLTSIKVLAMSSAAIPNLFLLEKLSIRYCSDLQTLPEWIGALQWLRLLYMYDCQDLLELPLLPESLVEVDVLNCKNLRRLSDLSNMKNLESLNLSNCKRLEVLPGLGCLQALINLDIRGCKNIRNQGIKGLDTLKSMEKLQLGGSEVTVFNFHEWRERMPGLRELSIGANPIPDWFGHEMRLNADRTGDIHLMEFIAMPVMHKPQDQSLTDAFDRMEENVKPLTGDKTSMDALIKMGENVKPLIGYKTSMDPLIRMEEGVKPLMDEYIPRQANVRCVGVIFFFVLHDCPFYSWVHATIIRGGSEIFRIRILHGGKVKDSGDELHVFICCENDEFVRNLENGDIIRVVEYCHNGSRVKDAKMHLSYTSCTKKILQRKAAKIKISTLRDVHRSFRALGSAHESDYRSSDPISTCTDDSE